MEEDVADRCRNEVIDLHRFFVDWYTGVAKKAEKVWSRLPDALATGFRMVTPDGRTVGRGEILDQLRGAHACYDAERAFNIWIEDFTCLAVTKHLVLATYEEWQKLDGDPRGRLSTVVFVRDKSAASGLTWLHVHETWLPA